jgi:DNA-binding NarL/FixJ family response regulator
MIKLAIVEDNTALRQSLEQLFNRTSNLKCVASLNNLLNVVSEFQKSQPDIVLMDIGLPAINGIEGVRTVRSNFENIQVIMFTVFEDDEKIFEAIRSGASGYLLKKTPPEEILGAIKELHEGGAPMSPSIARKVIHAFQVKPSPVLQDHQLTSREKEILYALVDGLSYKKIAEKYFVSIHTVRSHISSIYEKLHVNSKAQAVAKVLQPQQTSINKP